MSGRDRSAGNMILNRLSRNFIKNFLTVALVLTSIGILWYGLITGKIEFSGTIDAGIIVGVLITFGITAILRQYFEAKEPPLPPPDDRV